jgi:hypothetical protein
MARKRTTRFSHPVEPSTPSHPSLNSPEFDLIAKDWLEELIRRAKATASGPSAMGPSQAPPLTIHARGEGPYAFNFYLTNLYDLGTDPLGLMAGLEEVSRDALEAAVVDAGFSGLVAPAGPGMASPISVALDVERSIRLPAPGGADGTIH